MKKIKIFLASSEELKDERHLFEIEIYRKCKMWFDKGIFLHLDIWEDLSTKMSSQGRSQSEYNDVVKEADILVLLAFTKMGMYTAEEFETAFGQFKKTNKPFIFTYFKHSDINSSSITSDMMSLVNFQEKIKQLDHFYATYTDFYHLWNQFNKELDRLAENEFSTMQTEMDTPDSPNSTTNIGRQINMGDNSVYNENNN